MLVGHSSARKSFTVESHWRLAKNGNDAPLRWAFIGTTLRQLKENRLMPVDEERVPETVAHLAKMR